MNKVDLEVKIESLKKMITEGQQQTSNYAGQLDKLNTQLADANKIALVPSQFDDIEEAIKEGVGEFDFNDSENYNVEYGIDYDGKVYHENLELCNHENLVQMVHEKVCSLFAEHLPEDEFDRTESDNHPVDKLQG